MEKFGRFQIFESILIWRGDFEGFMKALPVILLFIGKRLGHYSAKTKSKKIKQDC